MLFIEKACIGVLTTLLTTALLSSANAQQVTVGSAKINSTVGIQVQSIKNLAELNTNTNNAAKACGDAGQLLDSSENCKNIAEADPSVKPHAKVDLPTCGTNQVLKATGPNSLACVAQDTVPAPPTCTGANRYLQWSGSAWACRTLTAAPPPVPTAALPTITNRSASRSRSGRSGSLYSIDKSIACAAGEKIMSGFVKCNDTAVASFQHGNGWYGKCSGRGRGSLTVTARCMK